MKGLAKFGNANTGADIRACFKASNAIECPVVHRKQVPMAY
jgi:hypothetical protein